MQKLCLNTPPDAQTKWLRRALAANRAPYLLLTTSLPQANELDSALKDASFQLVRRSGFMASDCVETPLKKKNAVCPCRRLCAAAPLSGGAVRCQPDRCAPGIPLFQTDPDGGDIMIQQDHLQIFDLTLTVRSPLFIGDYRTYTKKEYLYNSRSGKASFLDEQKFFTLLTDRGLVDQYTQFMLSDQSDLWAFLTKDCGIPNTKLTTLTRYAIEVGDTSDLDRVNCLHTFQRDAYGKAYIPGSSLKGALRTVWLLQAVRADQSTGHSLASDDNAAFPEEQYVNQLHLRLQKDGSIASDAVNSLFRGVQVSDSKPIPNEQMALCGKFDVLPDGSFQRTARKAFPCSGNARFPALRFVLS